MTSRTKVFKSSDIEMTGQCQLNSTSGSSPVISGSSSTSTARIVDKKSDHVLIEVTCSCGNKTIVRCQYE